MSILDLTISLDDAVADLRSRVSGAVLTERDPGYAESCAAWNVLFQHHPAVLVVAVRHFNFDLTIAFVGIEHLRPDRPAERLLEQQVRQSLEAAR